MKTDQSTLKKSNLKYSLASFQECPIFLEAFGGKGLRRNPGEPSDFDCLSRNNHSLDIWRKERDPEIEKQNYVLK